MSSYLRDLLKKYNLKLVYKELKSKGYIVRMPEGYPNFVFVQDSLSDEEIEKVILHEIGHAKYDDDTQKNYKDSYITRAICENGAKKFVVHEQVKKYIDLGNDASNANWLNLAKGIGTDDYWLVHEELTKYIID